VLRFLLVVGLASAGFVLPAVARAGTVAIFYYPWYGTPAHDGAWEHWSQNTSARRGSSAAARPLARARAQAAGGDPSRAVDVLDAEGRDVRKIGGHYVYQPQDFAASDWAEVRATAPATLRVFGGTARVGFAAAAHFDGFYTYDFVNYSGATFARLCAQAHAVHLLCAPSVGPGFDGHRAGEPLDRPRRNGATYDFLWTAALAAGPDIVTVTSYNEWGEGTQIEPAAARPGYRGYDGAWGLRGISAQNVYLTRTAYWAARFHGLSWSLSIRP
jgi:Glycosyl hydrolase family 99